LALPRRWWAWFGLGAALRHTDAVLLLRKLPRRWQLYLLRRAARFLLFDFDDAVFLRDSFALRGLHSGVRRRRFAAVVRAADLVVPGNEFLLQASGVHRARVIPTCVDTARYPLAEHQRTGAGVELVWIGSSSTLRGLERIRPLLEHLGKQLPGVCL